MTPRTALVWIVKNDSDASAQHEGRVYPGVAPQKLRQTVPYVCVHDQGGDDGYTLDGPDGKPQARLQLEVWDIDPDRCEKLAWRLRHILNGFGNPGGTVVGGLGGLRLEAGQCSLPEEDTEEDDNVADRIWYRRRMTVEFFFTEQPTPRLLADASA